MNSSKSAVGGISCCSDIRLFLVALLLLFPGRNTVHAQSNGVLREVWLNITGTAVSDLTNNSAFPSSPTFDGILTNGYEAPTDVYDNYGQRLRALVFPPTSGTYYFVIASDDNSQLFIGTNATPSGRQLIAHVDNWTSSRKYHLESGQKSAGIPLVGGQPYYLEALMKEGGGGDNLAVAWQKPGDSDPADGSPPIPNDYLIPFGVGPPQFSVQPASVTVAESGSATFNAQLVRSLGASFQWNRNGTNVPGATNSSLTISPVHLSDNGSTFYCRATNPFGATNSLTVSLTVTNDITPPTLLSARNPGDNTLVTVVYSELVDSVSATTTANYFINNGVAILSATLMPDGVTVLLRTSPLSFGPTYILTVNYVQDRAQNPNTILPDSQVAFSLNFTPLDVNYIKGANELAGPASRHSALAISEIMYHPQTRPDGKNLEFIEIYNSSPWPEDLTGHRLSGDIGYSFPNGTTIPAQGYRVIAANPADVQSVYGISGILGPLTNSTPGNSTNVLSNSGATIRLRDELDSVLQEVTYSDSPPWPAAADGAGHSLVLARPSYGENDPRAWARSDRINGSPGAPEVPAANSFRTVLINEILAHTDPPLEDFIELFNYNANAVDLGNCVLTDDPATNKFRIPSGTMIGARGFLAYTGPQLGFNLNAAGETVYLISDDGTRVLDVLRFDAQENGVAYGRYPDGAPQFRRLSSITRSVANARPALSDVIINEIMYDPPQGGTDNEFVELYNRGTNLINLGQWRIHGGISYTFPTNTMLSPGGYLVVANNVTNLLATHNGLNPSIVLGNYSGKLSNGGDVVSLDKPDDLVSTNQAGLNVTNVIHITMDEVRYGTGGRWGRWSSGGGSSLERIDPRANPVFAASWSDSDETAKSGWTTNEWTGILDLGAMANPDQLQLFLLGPGECLVDNVEVIVPGGANVVVNGTFDAGTSGWFFQGTHDASHWEPSGGYSGGCLHVIASDRGDTGANRIRAVLSQTLTSGTTVTLRAKVRWLKGDPELLLRLHGNWLESVGSSLATQNLGSPGARNSRTLTNCGPAIGGVQHAPILPVGGQAVTVTAQIDDPDSVAQATLFYRVDPSPNYASAPMVYRGAGFYSGTIPGQVPGTRVAFYIESRDAATNSAMSRFPNDAPARECLVGFGEGVPPGSFPAYRLWVTQTNVTRWTTREKQSNEALDATFVYAGTRVIYNAGTLYSGSPFHTPSYNSPAGNLCDYELNLPSDDPLLGAKDFVFATIANLNSDNTYQGEQTAFWLMRKLGAPYLHRRYIRMYFNGQQRDTVYEDAQQPNGDIVSQFFSNDSSGSLHKIEDWFEFDDSGDSMLGNVNSTLENFTTTGGIKKTARYRWNWRPRATSEAGHAFTNLFQLVDAMNALQFEPYRSWVNEIVNVDEFMKVLAVERIVGNWDSYGFARGKNMFAYKPTASSWMLLPWDIDFVFQAGGNPTNDPLFGGNEPVLVNFRAFPEFQRAYWRAFQAACDGPLQASTLAAQLDPHYAALAAASVPVSNPQSIKDYVAARRSYILSQLATVASPFTVNPTVTVSNGVGIVSGTAPIQVRTIEINGQQWIVRWTTVTNWIATVPLVTGSNSFSVIGLDSNGQLYSGASNSVQFAYNSSVPTPVGSVVINEIMANPAVPDSEYLELFNTSSNQSFDLSGWEVNGIGYTFPNGSFIGPGSFQVLAKDREAFNSLYGSGVLVFRKYDGNLQLNGETLSLLKPLNTSSNLVVDRVRYESSAPWPATTPGYSLQLRDATRDNSRVATWGAGSSVSLPQNITLLDYSASWKYMQVSNLDGISWSASAFNDSAWPSGPGLLAFENNPLITPVILTTLNAPGTPTNNADAGHAYYFRTRVVITNDLSKYSINASTYLDDGGVFYVNGNEVQRVRLAPGIVTNLTFTTSQPPGGDATSPDTFTLSPSQFVTGTNYLAVEVHQNQPASSDITFGLNLMASLIVSNSPIQATPGAPNSVLATLPAFPALWLNEAQPDNNSGPLDNAGQHDPWVELFNAGPTNINLGGYLLSPNYTNLNAWAFPSNVIVPAGGFLVVWCDNQTNQSIATAPHAAFRLSSGTGQIALSRIISNSVQLLDYLNYNNLPSNWSYGDVPDGQPFYRAAMAHVSPGATNNSTLPIAVFINEWMADNTHTLADPPNQNYQDWFEIYNPGPNAIDLGGYYLTDNLTNKFQSLVPNNGHYTVPAGGFLLVWADNDPSQNSTNSPDLHTSFALSKGGEAIGIFAPDGSQIDAVSFGPQTSDVSQGRSPDGSQNIIFFPAATPGAPNVVPNTAPILAPITNRTVVLGKSVNFTAQASDSGSPPQTLFFSLRPGAPPTASINPISGQFHWTPTRPFTNNLAVIVADNGTPSLSATQAFSIYVVTPPPITYTPLPGQWQLNWSLGTLQEADDVHGPYHDVTSQPPFIIDLTETKRFYRVRY